MKSGPRLILLLLSVSACRIHPPPESVRGVPAPDGADAGKRAAAAGPPLAAAPVSCRPERDQPIAAEPKRARRCVIDVGSRNVKLVVASTEGDDPRSIRGERLCRSRLQLGEKTFDQKARAARPLSPADQETLGKLLGDYRALCQQDGGELIAAVATEWARRATNAGEIRTNLRAARGVGLEVLSRDDEARFGYLAATRGAPGKTVLDFGSRSLQISYWPRGAPAPSTASAPLGIDEAGDRFFGKKEYRRYAAARAAFVTAVRTELAPHIAGLRRAMRAGTLTPELFSLAENGDIPLALAGKLWDAKQTVDEPTYAGLVKAHATTANPRYGVVTAVISVHELTAFAKQLESNPALFEELRSDRVKRIYGYKMLAVPALVLALADDLGLREVVLVPQEMPEGVLVEKLRGAATTK
jgi:hypothetical protein